MIRLVTDRDTSDSQDIIELLKKEIVDAVSGAINAIIIITIDKDDIPHYSHSEYSTMGMIGALEYVKYDLLNGDE